MNHEIKVPSPVLKVMETFEKHGYQAYLVGGCLRDLLMGIEPHDYDLAVSSRPEETKKLFAHTSDVGIAHGTVLVIEDGVPIECTTFRKESGYSDNRHPDHVEFVPDIESDLARRDFTINAMAWSPKTGLIDLYGGKEDLENRKIRAVGNPDTRFREDALRMMRAWRFAAKLGFNIEEHTLEALQKEENQALLKNIAVERIVNELNQILLSPHPEVIEGMTKLLEPWIPELDVMLHTAQDNPHHYTDVLHHTLDALRLSETADPIAAWALLLHDAGKPAVKTTDETGDHFKRHELESSKIAKRVVRDLKLPRKWQEEIPQLILRHDSFYALKPANIWKLRKQLGWDDEMVHRLFAVQKGDILAHTTHERMEKLNAFRDYYDREKERRPLSLKDICVNGEDVQRETGLSGREVGRILDRLLEELFYHPENNNREWALERIRQLAAQSSKREKN